MGLIGCFETLEYGCILLIWQRKAESDSLFWTCQQAPRFPKRPGIAQSLEGFLIYKNTRTPDIHKNIISFLLLHVSAELRHLQCV